MRIITYRTIKEYTESHPDADIALREWYHKVRKFEWNSFNDIKRNFGSASYAGNDRYVFNIKGNDYRLVALIIFNSRKLYIRFIGTHKEYDKIDCSTI